MIVATAGHIDHGKTSLVKALTGIDTDRLPEEKKRGMSIDLGFAYPKGAKNDLGFVDVPGHERFVRNMIAGVTAIDCALLVIAADDGPMPQTREHLAILNLLGIKMAAIALTKIDRVSAERIEEVKTEIVELIKGTSLENASVFPLSTLTGAGLECLSQWLDNEAARLKVRESDGYACMAIDRSFVIEGAGVVVTGAVSAGEAKLEDRLIIAPQGLEVRVRGIHAQNKKTQKGRAGERCAINIAAPRLSVDSVHRGQWLIAPEIHAPTRRFDARIQLLASEARALRHWAPVHLHIGAADIPARIALLEFPSLMPGSSALAQIVLQEPATALSGQRFVLRDSSGQRTIGGGYVIDPFSPARGRAKPERIALVKALDHPDAETAAQAALEIAADGFRIGEFICARNIRSVNADSLRKSLGSIRLAGENRDALAFSQERWQSLLTILSNLISSHKSAGSEGIPRAALVHSMRPRLHSIVIDVLLHDLVSKGQITHAGGNFKARDAAVELEAKDSALWTKVQTCLDDLRPPSLAEIATALKSDPRTIERLLQKVARMGMAVQIAPNRYYLPQRLRELAIFAEHVANETPGELVSIRAFRDKSGIGRNLSVEVLEFFDRLGFTGKAGEHRRICKPLADVKWVKAGS